MAWAALGKSLLKSSVKKVATKKLLNRKKKPKVGKVKTEKLMGDGGNTEKGGAIVKSGSSNIVPVSSPITAITKTETQTKSGSLMVIREKVLQIDKLLKGTLAAEKVQQKKQIKDQEKADRKEDEQEIEGAPKTEKTRFNLPLPKKVTSFWGEIKKYFGTVLFGWLVVRLIDWLPKLMPLLKGLARFADFVIYLGGVALNVLVSAVDIGYKAYDWTRGVIKNTFGEDAAQAFDSVMGTLKKVVMAVAAIGTGFAMMAGVFTGKPPKGTKQPKRGPKNKLKRAQKKIKRFTDPKRASKLKRVKNIKKIRADRLARVKKFGNLKKFAKAKKFVGKGIDLGKNIVKTGGKVAQTVTKGVKTAVKTTTPVIKSAAKTAIKLGKTGLKTATKGITTAVKTATPVIKSAAKTATTAAKTATTTATKLGKTGLKTGLKGLKSLQKVVSPIVKKIPFIGALLDFVLNYFVFKEPLGRAAFMAIGAGLAAWLGGIIGSVIPVGGTLVGAALGGWAGDKLAGALYDAIFKKKEPKEDKKDGEKKDTKKLSKEFKMGDKTYDLSKLMGGLSREEYEALGDRDKKQLDMRLKGYAIQNPEERHAAIKGNANNILPLDVNSVKDKGVSEFASYEDGAEEEIIVIPPSPSESNEYQDQKESFVPLVLGGGGGENPYSNLYEGG